MKRRRAGYTLVEVLMAAAVVVLGVAAAAALSLAMVAQEEANVRVARALNLQEQAARLYQLGLQPATISAILPPEPNVESVTFSSQTSVVSNAGSVEIANCSLVFVAGSLLASEEGSTLRTNELKLVRPTLR